MNPLLKNMFEQHEALPIPETAADDALDGLLFLIVDLNEMAMAHIEAQLAGIDPGFELDIKDADRLQRKLLALDGLSGSDIEIKQQLVKLVASLIAIRGLL